MVAVVWTPRAITELRKAYNYICKDSAQNAKKIVDGLVLLTDQLSLQPEMFPPDKFKKDNDGSWRAFEKYRYRISYRITRREIRIVRLRHTGRSPRQY